MSFAATLALVAGYQQGLAWMSRGRDTPFAAKIALWGGREIAGLVMVSLLAGTATIPFHRLPLPSHLALRRGREISWRCRSSRSGSCRAGILGLVTMPLGLDGFCWRMMGLGIEWMIAVALWVASLPGAMGRVAAFGTGALLLAGRAWWCSACSRRRCACGCIADRRAIVLMVRVPQPDVLMAADGAPLPCAVPTGGWPWSSPAMTSLRCANGSRPTPMRARPRTTTLAEGIRCDQAGCIGRLRDGWLVAIARTVEAFEEDCRRAVVVLSARNAPAGLCRVRGRPAGLAASERSRCAALARASRSPPRAGRPATTGHGPAPRRRRPRRRTRPATLGAAQPRDAMPRHEDLEAGD